MKRIWGLVLAAGVLACADAVHDTTSEVPERFIRTTTGTVQSYTPGEQIVIAGEDGADVSMELDSGARVADGIAAGQTVTVAWLVDSVGRTRVTSIVPFSTEAATSGSTSGAPPSKAYASSAEGSAMSTTPSGPMSGTPRPAVTAQVTPAYPVRTPPGNTSLR